MRVKIATWNLDFLRRASSPEKRKELAAALKKVNADVWVLTETDLSVSPGQEFTCLCSQPFADPKPYWDHKPDHREVVIWSKFPMREVSITEVTTSVCAEIATDKASLYIYGTVIGTLGHPSQNVDQQIADWRKVSQAGKLSICIAGDFNLQFCRFDNFTDGSKEKIASCFADMGVQNLTSGIAQNVDHIALSNHYLAKAPLKEAVIWNAGAWKVEQKFRAKQLSDHIGVSVELDISETN